MYMNDFWMDVLSAMQMMGITIVLLLIAYFANMLFSLYVNIALIKEQFSMSKLLKGLLKVLVLALGLALTTLLLVSIPAFLSYVGLGIPEEFIESYSIIAVIAVFCQSIMKYAAEAVEKAKQIIDNFDPLGNSKADK